MWRAEMPLQSGYQCTDADLQRFPSKTPPSLVAKLGIPVASQLRNELAWFSSTLLDYALCQSSAKPYAS